MKKLSELDQYRDTSESAKEFFGDVGSDKGGRFYIRSPVDKTWMCIIASNGNGWDHVSVSKEKMIPSWTEMEYVKRMFFKDDETAYQLHVPPKDHINNNPFVLHIWRPHLKKIPMPPKWMV